MKKFLTCEEVADHYDIKIITVYRWIREKTLPAMKIGGRNYRIRSEDLAIFEKKHLTTRGGDE